MNWINMSDREKLFCYAKKYQPKSLKILKKHEFTDSYYYDCNEKDNEDSIMEYNIEQYDKFKKHLIKMWRDKNYINVDLLATITSTITFKNMPLQSDSVTLKNETSEVNTKINNTDTLPIYIYEF